MTTTLITGANKGLGFETARRLIAAGHTVYVGSRDAGRGQRAAGRLGRGWSSSTSPTTRQSPPRRRPSTPTAGWTCWSTTPASKCASKGTWCPAPRRSPPTMRSLFETNVFGVVRVTHAFLPLLQRSAAPVVVNVSSGLASLTRLTTPCAVRPTPTPGSPIQRRRPRST